MKKLIFAIIFVVCCQWMAGFALGQDEEVPPEVPDPPADYNGELKP